MTTKARIIAAGLSALAVGIAIGVLVRPTANDAHARGTEQGKGKDAPKSETAESDEATVRKTAEEFAKAFDKGDAKAVASLWTEKGEFVGADGEALRGRKEIETSYAEFFQKNPKAKAEVNVESVKLLGKHTAVEEGTIKVTLAGQRDAGVGRYSALHVRDGDAWRMASVREWVPDPSQLVTLKDVEWLIGDWSAKTGDTTASVNYAWDEDKSSIRSKYVVKRGDKVVASGSQVIRKDPQGGLRSWQFDGSGANGEWAWSREGKNWVIDAAGVLPDGSEVTASNLLVPLGKDGFTWQSIERTAAGSPLPDGVPVKVTRVKDKK